VFDTTTDSRKHTNLQSNPDVAFVFGGEESEITVQYEGTAQELKGPELVYYKQLYFDKFPDGREREKQ
jgi:pyridoxine/pyridoxamine 5'-phosphate oxidase